MDSKNFHSYVKGIYDLYLSQGDKQLAAPMEKYMRNRFVFFGIKAPHRKLLSAEYFRSYAKPAGNDLRVVIQELWNQPYRELHYFAIELLSKSKKSWSENDLKLHEYLITRNSWWDSVDYLANHVCGPWFKLFPEQIAQTEKWNNSENIWLQRMSLLFQLKYKSATDFELLKKYITNLSESKEFFVQKAIGWVLREYSKTDPDVVIKFVEQNKLKPLSKREALKILNK